MFDEILKALDTKLKRQDKAVADTKKLIAAIKAISPQPEPTPDPVDHNEITHAAANAAKTKQDRDHATQVNEQALKRQKV